MGVLCTKLDTPSDSTTNIHDRTVIDMWKFTQITFLWMQVSFNYPFTKIQNPYELQENNVFATNVDLKQTRTATATSGGKTNIYF